MNIYIYCMQQLREETRFIFYTVVEKLNLIFVCYDDQHLFYFSTVAKKDTRLHLF